MTTVASLRRCREAVQTAARRKHRESLAHPLLQCLALLCMLAGVVALRVFATMPG